MPEGVSRHREYPFVERDGGAMRDAGDVNLQPVGCLGDGQRPAALNAISRNKSKREKTLGRRDRLPVGHRPERSGRAPFLTALQDAIWSARRFATAASTACVDARLPTVIRAAPSG